jgi:hypothetical protein
MSDFFFSLDPGISQPPLVILLRLVIAMVLGGVVVFVYRRTRSANDTTPSFAVTLVLLTILIAVVTQVIGDNVARAFSLVGALSIVRFRTVVRDTQDTAYVIFAVAVGMAVGAGHPWLAIGAILVVGFAAYIMRDTGSGLTLPGAGIDGYDLQVRLGIGADPQTLLAPTLDTFVRRRRLQSIGTAGKGLSIEVAYSAELQREDSAGELVKALNRLDGVQSVSLVRHDALPEIDGRR